jgi:hypothetical protein
VVGSPDPLGRLAGIGKERQDPRPDRITTPWAGRWRSTLKLVYCGDCQDIVRLPVTCWGACACGAAGGGYADALQAYWGGPQGSAPLGFSSPAFEDALCAAAQDRARRRRRALGHDFEAFVIPWNAPTMRACVAARAFTPDEVPVAEALAKAHSARIELLRNAADCRACGERVVSWRDRHHRVRCGCGATAVDGGAAYQRLTGRAASAALFVVAYPPDVPGRG